jgi:hypothetical protein
MPKFYFTFGSNHATKQGRSLRNNYCVIEAPTDLEAREAMVNARGLKWSTSYDEARFEGQAEEYDLKEVSLEDL